MKCISVIVILFALFIVVITPASADNFEITSGQPVAGDTITIKGSTSANKPLDVSIDFEKIEKIAPGKREYRYDLDFENPLKSNFSVTAKKVEKLNVGVKILVWWTLDSKANSEQVATIAQNNVPKGTYHIRLDGTAAPGQSSVSLKIKASSVIKSDSNGNFEYSYKTTKDFPAGTYNLTIDGMKRSITLLQKKEKNEDGQKLHNNTDLKVQNDTLFVDPISTPEPSVDKNETEKVTIFQRFLNFLKFW